MKTHRTYRQTMRQERRAVRRWYIGTSARIGVLCIFAACAVLYMGKTNDAATRGFAMNDLEQQIVSLERETRKLDVDIATYRSMESVQERLANMPLVAAGTMEYLTPVGTAVAVNH